MPQYIPHLRMSKHTPFGGVMEENKSSEADSGVTTPTTDVITALWFTNRFFQASLFLKFWGRFFFFVFYFILFPSYSAYFSTHFTGHRLSLSLISFLNLPPFMAHWWLIAFCFKEYRSIHRHKVAPCRNRDQASKCKRNKTKKRYTQFKCCKQRTFWFDSLDVFNFFLFSSFSFVFLCLILLIACF